MIWGRHRLDPQPHRLGNMLFDARIDLRERADGAGDLAGRNLVPRCLDALARAGEFGIGVGQLHAERGRFGVNAMRTPDGRRQLVLERTALERSKQLIEVGYQKIGGPHQLDVEARCRAHRTTSCPGARIAPAARRSRQGG